METNRCLTRVCKHNLLIEKLLSISIVSILLIWKRIPREGRVALVERLTEKHMGAFLSVLNKEERIDLMNGIFPVITKEFPLMDLDVLAAFPPKNS